LEELEIDQVKHFLIFGASGTIGAECSRKLSEVGKVITVNRDYSRLLEQLSEIENLNGIIWAQGLNVNDAITNFDSHTLEQIMQANLGFVLQTAQILLQAGKVKSGSNLLVISSIWSQNSRPNKLTYSISKAAILAAVRSMAVDLGKHGIQVNAVAPGPIESPMTKSSLSNEQIELIIDQTPLKRLVSLEEVTNLVTKFAVGEILGVTGPEIDGGWGISKLV
jgi:NAD(P)-dependent dehydrogenase (short-subunit alcohol dehydrogenase family)